MGNNMFKNSKYGVNYGIINVNNLLFQDDILKLETNVENLNEANKFYETFQNNNEMEFHKTKSKIVTNEKVAKKILLNSEEIESTNQYKYLGDIITEDDKYDTMIKTRSNEILGITAELMSINNNITKDTKYMESISLYMNSIILTKLLNNAEMWHNLTTANKEKLQTIQDTALKRLLKMPTSTPSIPLR